MDKVEKSIAGYNRTYKLQGCSCLFTKKVYCSCGRIVDLDANYFNRRLNLGKSVECSHCRNIRISHEIDELNEHFLGKADVEQNGLAI